MPGTGTGHDTTAEPAELASCITGAASLTRAVLVGKSSLANREVARTWVVSVDLMEEGATEPDCRWRYSSLLGRDPTELGPTVDFCLLNPSLRRFLHRKKSRAASTARPASAPMMIPGHTGPCQPA